MSSRPIVAEIVHGKESWDVDVNDNFQKIFVTPYPWPEFANFGALPDPTLFRNCSAVAANVPYLSDGITWNIMSVVAGGTVGNVGLDENGTSSILYPGGASIGLTGQATGILKLTLPQDWNDTYLSFIIDIIEDTTAGANKVSLWCSGFLDDTGDEWTNIRVEVLSGRADYPVKFGREAGTVNKVLLSFGDISKDWENLRVRVRNFSASQGGFTVGNWLDSWLVSVIASEVDITYDETIQLPNTYFIWESLQGYINQQNNIFESFILTPPVINIKIPGGWKLHYEFRWSCNDTTTNVSTRIDRDSGAEVTPIFFHRSNNASGGGIVLPTLVGGVPGATTNTSTNQIERAAGFIFYPNLAVGIHTFALEWAGTNAANDEATIYDARMHLEKL